MFPNNLNSYNECNDNQNSSTPKYRHILKSLKLISEFILTVERANSVLDRVKSSDNMRRQELNNALASSMIERISQAILSYIQFNETLQSTYSLNMDEVLQYASDDLSDLDAEDEEDADEDV